MTGEDRFLGYSLMMGARAALVWHGPALTDLQARLLAAYGRDVAAFVRLASLIDASHHDVHLTGRRVRATHAVGACRGLRPPRTTRATIRGGPTSPPKSVIWSPTRSAGARATLDRAARTGLRAVQAGSPPDFPDHVARHLPHRPRGAIPRFVRSRTRSAKARSALVE